MSNYEDNYGDDDDDNDQHYVIVMKIMKVMIVLGIVLMKILNVMIVLGMTMAELSHFGGDHTLEPVSGFREMGIN